MALAPGHKYTGETKKSTSGKTYKVAQGPAAPKGAKYLDVGGNTGKRLPASHPAMRQMRQGPVMGSSKYGPFSGAGRGGVAAPGRPRGGGRGGGGGRGRGGGGGGGGGGRPRPAPTSFNINQLRQNIKPSEFQTGAYEKMEGLYDEVPDYFKKALAESRMAGSMGIESELAAAGGRGFGPGSGFTGSALKDYGMGLNRQLMGGQMDAAQRTFADKAALATNMGNLGTGIASNMANLYGQNIGAYNALANYALGNERNQIGWYNAQTAAQQGQMQPMMQMMNMIMQSGAFL